MTTSSTLRWRVVAELASAALLILLFGLWLSMLYARPRAERLPGQRARVAEDCADIAVLPFRNQREVVLCAGLGDPRRQPLRFALLTVALPAGVALFVYCNRRRKALSTGAG